MGIRDPGWKKFGSRIRDGKLSDPGSGINIPDPQHCFVAYFLVTCGVVSNHVGGVEDTSVRRTGRVYLVLTVPANAATKFRISVIALVFLGGSVDYRPCTDAAV
jgi:hypothetical protein